MSLSYFTGATAADGAFSLRTTAGEQHFGPGCLSKLPSIMAERGVSKALVVGSGTSRSMAQLDHVAGRLGTNSVGICADATHQIYPDIVAVVVERARAVAADCIVSVGGGGPVGYGKMAVRELGVPLFAVVTTYSGSEVTSAQGSIVDGNKVMTVDEQMRPAARIYDTDLMKSLPVNLSVVSGMNAMAHAVEALYSKTADRFSSMVCEEAIRVMAQGLTRLVESKEPKVVEAARLDCAYAAFLCICAMGGLGIEHKLAHVLGGTFKTPHAASHCVVLPHAIAFNERFAPEACARISRALGDSSGDGAAMALYRLQQRLGAPTSLRDERVGLAEADLPRLASLAVSDTARYAGNPAPFEEHRVLALVGDAWRGDPPGTSLGAGAGL